MTPPILLTSPTPKLHARVDRRPLTHTDCGTQRLPLSSVPFAVRAAHPAPSAPASASATSIASAALTGTQLLTSAHASVPSDPEPLPPHPHPHAVARQWTGAPIRAIVPLPRRTRALPLPHGVARPSHDHDHAHDHDLPASIAIGSPACLPPARVILDELDTDTDSEVGSGKNQDEDGDGDEDGEGEGEGTDALSWSRYCSYESITASEGLSARSFEELRVECYAQSLVARGTRPPPVVQPLLAIPPAFVPRILLRS